MRKQLRQNMSIKFENELNNSISTIRSAISPYSQFVNVEFEKFTRQSSAIVELKLMIERLKEMIEMLDVKETKKLSE